MITVASSISAIFTQSEFEICGSGDRDEVQVLTCTANASPEPRPCQRNFTSVYEHDHLDILLATIPKPPKLSPPSPSMLDHAKEERSLADWITTVLKTAPVLHPLCICADFLAAVLNKFNTLMLPESDAQFLKPKGTVLRGYGDLLDAAVAFANSIWSAEEQAKFLRCTGLCEKDVEVSSFIAEYRTELQPIQGPEYTSLQELAIQLFNMLADVCNNIKQDHGGAPKLEKKRASKWPPSPSKFIPRGAPDAVAAFSAWARLAKHIIPIFTLSELIFICLLYNQP